MNKLIAAKIKAALIEVLNFPKDHVIHINDRLKEDLGLDSMSSLSFLLALEDSIQGFVVDPDSLEMAHLATVKSITEYVAAHVILQEFIYA